MVFDTWNADRYTIGLVSNFGHLSLFSDVKATWSLSYVCSSRTTFARQPSTLITLTMISSSSVSSNVWMRGLDMIGNHGVSLITLAMNHGASLRCRHVPTYTRSDLKLLSSFLLDPT